MNLTSVIISVRKIHLMLYIVCVARYVYCCDNNGTNIDSIPISDSLQFTNQYQDWQNENHSINTNGNLVHARESKSRKVKGV